MISGGFQHLWKKNYLLWLPASLASSAFSSAASLASSALSSASDWAAYAAEFFSASVNAWQAAFN